MSRKEQDDSDEGGYGNGDGGKGNRDGGVGGGDRGGGNVPDNGKCGFYEKDNADGGGGGGSGSGGGDNEAGEASTDNNSTPKHQLAIIFG